MDYLDRELPPLEEIASLEAKEMLPKLINQIGVFADLVISSDKKIPDHGMAVELDLIPNAYRNSRGEVTHTPRSSELLPIATEALERLHRFIGGTSVHQIKYENKRETYWSFITNNRELYMTITHTLGDRNNDASIEAVVSADMPKGYSDVLAYKKMHPNSFVVTDKVLYPKEHGKKAHWLGKLGSAGFRNRRPL